MLEINKDLKFLRKKSKKIEKIDNEIRDLAFKMAKIMKENKGIGLAACQIGYLKRVVVINEENGFIVFINPVILQKSKEKSEMEEGCLSLPECYIKIKRSNKIKVRALDLEGKEVVLELEDLEARVVQHEIDHLDGILITNKISLIQKIKNLLTR